MIDGYPLEIRHIRGSALELRITTAKSTAEVVVLAQASSTGRI
jgi:hypothetical protein